MSRLIFSGKNDNDNKIDCPSATNFGALRVTLQSKYFGMTVLFFFFFVSVLLFLQTSEKNKYRKLSKY